MWGWWRKLWGPNAPDGERRGKDRRKKSERRWAGQFKPAKDPRRRKDRRKKSRRS